MKIAITGSRDWDNYLLILKALRTLDLTTDTIVLGDARGADDCAHQACERLGLNYQIKYADWTKYGRAAGPIRNRAMLDEEPDELWYFHNDIESSKGTRNCVKQARAKGIPVRDGRTIG